MWKKTLLALLIVLGLIIQMNVIADTVDVVETPTRTDGDLEIQNITLSGVVIDDKYAQVVHTVTVNFTNTGASPITGKVYNITIWNATTGIDEDEFSLAIDDVNDGAFVEMELLDFWTPTIEGEYWINVHVNLSAPYGNVSLNKSFTIENVYDVYPVLTFPNADILVACEDSTNKSLICNATVHNIGNIDATGFDAKLEIWEGGGIVNTTSYAVTVIIPPNANISITFDEWFNHTYGEFDFVVYTELVGDDHIANDLVTKTFNVTYEFYDRIEKGNVEGKVVDADNATIALEGVNVTLEEPPLEFNTTTDINGTFNLSGLPTANDTVTYSYTLLFTLEGYYGARLEGVNITNATTTYIAENVTMQKIPPSMLYGYVMDEDGAVLPGAYIEFGTLNATSDPTGYYEFVNLTAGLYTLSVSLSGYKFNPVVKELVHEEQLKYNITMLADVTVTVTFTPAPSAVVGDDEPVTIAFNAAFDPLTVNSNTVIWEEIGTPNNTVLYPSISVSNGNKTIELTLAEKMKRGFNYKVSVTTLIKNVYNESMLTGNASTTFKVKGPEVTESSPYTDEANVTVTRREFYVVFDIDMSIATPLTDGNFTIRASGQDDMVGTLAYLVAERKLTFTTTEDLLQEETYQFSVSHYKTTEGGVMEPFAINFNTQKIESTGTITGIATFNETALEGALVELIPEGETEATATTNTAADGSYEFLDVTPGNYNVKITKDGHLEININTTVTAGQNTDNGVTEIPIEPEADDDDDESIFAKYWWAFVGLAILLVIIIIVVIVLMMMKKPEEEEEDDRGRRARAPRAERASYGGDREAREYDEDEEGSECPNCGEVVSDAEEECPNCGVEFEEDAFECPVCGDQIDYEATECPSCGAAFQEDEEEEEGDEDEYDEEEEPEYEVEVEDEDGVTRYNPAEEDEEEEEYGGESSEEENYD